MTGKEISVFSLGLILSVFLIVMKNRSEEELVLDNTNMDIVHDISDNKTEIKQPKNTFQPNTNFPTIASIFDVPEWQFDLNTLGKLTAEELVKSFHEAISEEKYFEPENDNALFYLVSLKTLDEDFPDIQSLTEDLVSIILHISDKAILESDADNLIFAISRLKSLKYNKQKILELENELSVIEAINQLYIQGIAQINDNEILNDDNNDAWHTAKQSFILAPDNPKTHELIDMVESHLIESALLAAEEIDFQLANSTLQKVEMLNPDSDNLFIAQQDVEDLKQQRYQWLDQQINRSIQTVNVERAEHMLQQLKLLDISQDTLEEYIASIKRIKIYGKYQEFEVFSDKSTKEAGLPKMVVMPTGSFLMGSSNGSNNQAPKHLVTIKYGFAVSQTEISVGDFRLFIESTGYETEAEKNNSSKIYDLKTGRLKNKLRINWQKDYSGKKAKEDLPVIHISWNDAKAYTQWLSQETGKQYRLLSESEFEYVLRAGSGTYYPWGDGTPSQVLENLAGKLDRSKRGVRSRWINGFDDYNDKFWGPAPVGSFVSNPFRLFDTAGNVMEWVEDCWHDSYTRAPVDGSPWVNPGCNEHVIRGGAWSGSREEFSSAHRYTAKSHYTDARVGFRIALDLSSHEEKN